MLAALFVLWPFRSAIHSWLHPSLNLALAEDDEEDEEDDEDEGSSSKTTTKYETVTTYVKLPDQVIKKNIVTTIYDSDGDGIFDPDDKNPQIHELLIVKDENLNGIDDAYEQL